MDNQPLQPAGGQPPTPPDPMPAPNPTPTPTSNPMLTPSSAPASSAPAPTDPVSPSSYSPTVAETAMMSPRPQLKRPLKIIFLIAGILLLGLIIMIIWWVIHSQPRNIAADALKNLAQSPFLKTDSTYRIALDEQTTGLSSATFTTTTISQNQADQITAHIQGQIALQQNSQDLIKFDSEAILMPEGTIYLRLSGLRDALDQPQLAALKQSLESFLNSIELIESDWWEVKIPDLARSLDLPTNQQQAFTQAYDCLRNTVTKRDNQQEFVRLYLQSPFISAVETKDAPMQPEAQQSIYRLDIDSDLLTAFLNQTVKSSAIQDLSTCFNQAAELAGSRTTNNSQSLSDTTFSEEKVASVVGEWPTIYASIGVFDHRLTATHFETTANRQTTTADTTIIYPSSVTIPTPESYRPISEAVNILLQSLSQTFPTVTINNSSVIMD